MLLWQSSRDIKGEKIKTSKGYWIFVIILGGVFCLAAVIMITVGAISNDSYLRMTLLVLAGVIIFSGIILVIKGIFSYRKDNKRITIADNPDTFAYYTYGGHGNFKRFIAYLSRDEQISNNKKSSKGRAAVNTLGIASAVVFGVGFISLPFKKELEYDDMFISDNEIAFCSPRSTFLDADFTRIGIDAISDIEASVVDEKFTRLKIYLFDQEYAITADIPLNRTTTETVVDAVRAIKTSIDARESADDDFFSVPTK